MERMTQQSITKEISPFEFPLKSRCHEVLLGGFHQWAFDESRARLTPPVQTLQCQWLALGFCAISQMENETVTHSWGCAVQAESSIALIVKSVAYKGKLLLANGKKNGQQKST